jgi:hypothetical protein
MWPLQAFQARRKVKIVLNCGIMRTRVFKYLSMYFSKSLIRRSSFHSIRRVERGQTKEIRSLNVMSKSKLRQGHDISFL